MSSVVEEDWQRQFVNEQFVVFRKDSYVHTAPPDAVQAVKDVAMQ